MKKIQKLTREEMRKITAGENAPCLSNCTIGLACGQAGCDPETGEFCNGFCQTKVCAGTGLNYGVCVLF